MVWCTAVFCICIRFFFTKKKKKKEKIAKTAYAGVVRTRCGRTAVGLRKYCGRDAGGLRTRCGPTADPLRTRCGPDVGVHSWATIQQSDSRRGRAGAVWNETSQLILDSYIHVVAITLPDI